MRTKNNRTFAFGSPDGLHSSIWRLWSHGNNIYLAARSIAGDIKASLHEEGICQISFTSQFMNSDHPLRSHIQGSRHIVTWHRKAINPNLFRLVDIVIPHSQMQKIKMDTLLSEKVEWSKPCDPCLNTQVTFFLSDIDFGSNNWIGRKRMNTNLLHKGQIQDGKTLYLVYYGHNEPSNLAKVQLIENEPANETAVYRLIYFDTDPKSKVGCLIDSSPTKIKEQSN